MPPPVPASDVQADRATVTSAAARCLADLVTAAWATFDEIAAALLSPYLASLRRLRRQVGQSVAIGRIQADPGPGDTAPTFTREELAAAWGISE